MSPKHNVVDNSRKVKKNAGCDLSRPGRKELARVRKIKIAPPLPSFLFFLALFLQIKSFANRERERGEIFCPLLPTSPECQGKNNKSVLFLSIPFMAGNCPLLKKSGASVPWPVGGTVEWDSTNVSLKYFRFPSRETINGDFHTCLTVCVFLRGWADPFSSLFHSRHGRTKAPPLPPLAKRFVPGS